MINNEKVIKLNKPALKNGGGVQRSSSVELLRILMMLSMIAHHYTVNSGINELYDVHNVTLNMVSMQLFGMWGQVGINVFTIISGYFMIDRHLSVKKLLRIILEMYFYATAYFVVFALTGYETISFSGLIKLILLIPREIGVYYGGSMVMMFLFVPLINKAVENFTKKEYQILLGLLLLYFTVLSSLKISDNYNLTMWLITAYLIGGYLKRTDAEINVNTRKIVFLMSASIALMIASVVILDFIGEKMNISSPYFLIHPASKILSVVSAVLIFLVFKNWKLKYNRWINTIVSATFGILLLHSCSPSVRKLLWVDIFDAVGHYENRYTVLYSSMVVVCVFAITCIIDILRQRFIEKPFF